MKNSLVSVIISAYNHENYIQDTIQSVIDQTYENIELLILDDGSKDATFQKMLEMKSKCEKRFKRVIFETKENEGTCKSLNKLLDLAEGEYVYIIASDDLSKPNAIEKEFKFLNGNSDYALCVGDDDIIDADGKVAYWDKNRNLVYDKNKAVYITFADFLQKLHKFNFNSEKFGTYNLLSVDNHVPNGYLIRKSIFQKTGYYTPDAPVEDYWLMLQISKYAKMKFIDEPLYSYRWHNNNSIKNVDKMREMALKTIKTEANILKNLDLSICMPDVAEYVKFGYKYKHFGLKNIFEVAKYKNPEFKIQKITIFFIPFVFKKRI